MKIKKAILTGGGRATRLFPITTTINKHLLPLANKPMIFHAIERAVEAGVEEIFINTNPGETELQKYIGDGGHWGITIKFFEQTGGPQGIAHVVKQAEKFIGDDPFLFFLSDNIMIGNLKEIVDEFCKSNDDCTLVLSQVPDARHFGVPVFENNKLIDVIEKPTNPPNNFAVTGIYLYGPKVFFKAYDKIEKSARGEYEISSIHSYFLKNNYKVGHKEITGYWKDTGQAEDLLTANRLLLEQMTEGSFPNHGAVDKSAEIKGKVQIGVGSRIGKQVKIQGPVMIGENCVLEDCTIGPNVTIGAGTEVYGANIKDSILLENSLIKVSINITDSLLGKGIKLIKRENGEAEAHRMVLGDKTVIEM
ncbi:MAG: Glucose-1-phosphate thymidyltransferase [Candidatus Magasanikbacteria bacterium GW2011_GWC2_37_14]|uniref:Glucose-1-phosphate thymidyltransferase n=1 Tax=Candidatus Magasanikbacteria bacterium GW2011_GWC2_37_14 TaxID=1619046 RepID=A0A0G0GBE4_9BACT|nr:MAG: Glucose-1-phosphate thymidyltransferase [Candidatus Magasanikbacteria bacterium GW2011_GWC2_37_14]